MPDRTRNWWPSWGQVLVSLLVVVLGGLTARMLDRVDRDLRILYAEYTLAATDLAHISGDVMRYRATIIQAFEARSRQDAERIMVGLPDQRERIRAAVDRYDMTGKRVGPGVAREQQALTALRESLESYFVTADETIALLKKRWDVKPAKEAAALRSRLEVHIRDTAGARLVAVSLALDRLLDTVAEVGKGMQDEGIVTIREISAALLVGSVLLALVNLAVLSGRRPRKMPVRPTPELDPTASPCSTAPADRPDGAGLG